MKKKNTFIGLLNKEDCLWRCNIKTGHHIPKIAPKIQPLGDYNHLKVEWSDCIST